MANLLILTTSIHFRFPPPKKKLSKFLSYPRGRSIISPPSFFIFSLALPLLCLFFCLSVPSQGKIEKSHFSSSVSCIPYTGRKEAGLSPASIIISPTREEEEEEGGERGKRSKADPPPTFFAPSRSKAKAMMGSGPLTAGEKVIRTFAPHEMRRNKALKKHGVAAEWGEIGVFRGSRRSERTAGCDQTQRGRDLKVLLHSSSLQTEKKGGGGRRGDRTFFLHSHRSEEHGQKGSTAYSSICIPFRI